MDASATDGALGFLAQLRRRWRWLLAAVLLVLVYALAGFLWVPHIARVQITRYVQQQLHRRVDIGAIAFNPFTLTVRVERLALAEADGTPMAAFDELLIDASASSLLHWAWTFSEIRLVRPALHLRVAADGTLNLARLAPAAPAAKPSPTPTGGLPAIRIGRFAVVDGSVQYEDRSRDQPFDATLRPIEFALTDFRTQPRFENHYRFEAQTAAGEKLAWEGEFALQPLGSTGRFSVDGLRAATITSYLADALPVAVPSGTADVQGEYRFGVGEQGGLTLHLPMLRIHSLAVAPRAAAVGDAAWLQLPEAQIADVDVDLLRRQLRVGSVGLQGVRALVRRDTDGSLNWSHLGSSAAATPAMATVTAAAPTPAAAANGAWAIALQTLSLRDVHLQFEDRSVTPAARLSIEPLALTVQDYASSGATPLTFDLDTGLGGAAHLHGRGSWLASPSSAQVDLELKGFDLLAVQPYVAAHTAVRLDSGRLGVQARIAYAAQPARGQPQLAVTGAVDVADLSTHDTRLNARFITWKSLQLQGLRYQQGPDAFDVDRIVAHSPYARVLIGADGTLNVTELLAPGKAHATTTGPSTASSTSAAPANKVVANRAAPPMPMPMRIRRIEIEDGAANFSDRSIEPNFSTAMLGLNGAVVGLSSAADSRAQVDLTGNVDRYAPVSIKGSLNLLSATAFSDVTLHFSNMELTTFNPYSGKFAGYSIAQGKLSTDLHYHVENRRLEASHHIVIDQLEFGAATDSKQAVPLPVKLAAALLKDRDGVITLDLPVNGTLDDPQFRIGPIIWKAFVGLLTKAVTAPFSWLGSLFGGGGEQLSYVDFQPGSAALAADDIDKLHKLAAALAQRPQLQLDVPLQTRCGCDAAALAHAALERALTGSARFAALAALYDKQFQAKPNYPVEVGAMPDAQSAWLEQQLLSKYAPSADRLDALGRARADAVEAAVLADTDVKPERIFLTSRASGDASADAQSARMDLKLQ